MSFSLNCIFSVAPSIVPLSVFLTAGPCKPPPPRCSFIHSIEKNQCSFLDLQFTFVLLFERLPFNSVPKQEVRSFFVFLSTRRPFLGFRLFPPPLVFFEDHQKVPLQKPLRAVVRFVANHPICSSVCDSIIQRKASFRQVNSVPCDNRLYLTLISVILTLTQLCVTRMGRTVFGFFFFGKGWCPRSTSVYSAFSSRPV